MIGRRANQRHLMTALDIISQIHHDGHMGMPAANEHQMLSHFPSLSIDFQRYLVLSHAFAQPLLKYSTCRMDNFFVSK
jgi:hypothetical protein